MLRNSPDRIFYLKITSLSNLDLILLKNNVFLDYEKTIILYL